VAQWYLISRTERALRTLLKESVYKMGGSKDLGMRLTIIHTGKQGKTYYFCREGSESVNSRKHKNCPVTQACSSSYLGNRAQEDHGSKLAWANK
jgi:hypothetical protein